MLFWKVTIEGLIVILSRERGLTGPGLGRQRGVLGGGGRCKGGLDVTKIASEHGTAVSLNSRSLDSKGQVFLSLICSSCGAGVCVYVELQHQQRHGCVITIRGSGGRRDQTSAFPATPYLGWGC